MNLKDYCKCENRSGIHTDTDNWYQYDICNEYNKIIEDGIRQLDDNEIFSIAIFTGMRIGEILVLQPSDIDLENNIIHITKTISSDKNKKPIIGHKNITTTINTYTTIFDQYGDD